MSDPKRQKNISQLFGKWLLICITIAFAVTTLFIYLLQTRMSEDNSTRLLQLNIQDVKQDILDASDENLLALANTVANEINNSSDQILSSALAWYKIVYDAAEINIIDTNGIIVATTHPNFLGYDMASGEQSAAFLPLLADETEYVQSYMPTSSDATLYRKYAGVALASGGFVQVGYDANRFQRDVDKQVIGVTRNRHVGENGCLIIADENQIIVSDRHGYEGHLLSKTGIVLTPDTPEDTRFTATVYGIPCFCMYTVSEGYSIVAVLPTSEAVLSRNVSVGITAAMELLVFIALFCMVYVLLKRQIVDNVQKMNQSLSAITGGDLNQVVDVRSNLEFSALSNDINTTVDALKQHIDAAAARIDQELEYAKAIQSSALPSVFPPYPHRTDFSIYAQMDTAKEVGGDFYDFYLLDKNTLGFLVADVSGKGIPAAMFMMKAKTIIQDLAESGADPAHIFTLANNKLCEGNDAMMFVTAWLGILDTRTGELTYSNAGHNPPLLRRAGGEYEYLRMDPGFVLAGLEDMPYSSEHLTLQPGDSLFLYTDGVTEALDPDEQLYGENRLRDALNSASGRSAAVDKLLPYIRTELEHFARGAEQADDITMLGLTYHGAQSGGSDMKTLTVPATTEQLDTVQAFIDSMLETIPCTPECKIQLQIAVEELFVNIASYAYNPEVGEAIIGCNVDRMPPSITIQFRDRGIPFNPLEKEDADISLSAEERDIGGLGIFMVKDYMDEVTYVYEDGQNILTMRKDLEI